LLENTLKQFNQMTKKQYLKQLFQPIIDLAFHINENLSHKFIADLTIYTKKKEVVFIVEDKKKTKMVSITKKIKLQDVEGVCDSINEFIT
jgi:hypothetical protein